MRPSRASFVSLSELQDSDSAMDCLCFSTAHIHRRLCYEFKGLKPSAATAPNSPKSHTVPVKGLLGGQEGQDMPWLMMSHGT